MNAIPPGLSLIGICAIAVAAGAVNKVAPGEFIIDHPTLINLGFEWCSSAAACATTLTDPQQKLTFFTRRKEPASSVTTADLFHWRDERDRQREQPAEQEHGRQQHHQLQHAVSDQIARAQL